MTLRCVSQSETGSTSHDSLQSFLFIASVQTKRADEVHTGDVEAVEILEKTQEKTFSIEEKNVFLGFVEESRCLWDSASRDFLNKKKKHEAFNVTTEYYSGQVQTV